MDTAEQREDTEATVQHLPQHQHQHQHHRGRRRHRHRPLRQWVPPPRVESAAWVAQQPAADTAVCKLPVRFGCITR